MAAPAWLVLGYADRLVHPAECVFGDDVVAVLTEDQADGWAVVGMTQLVVHYTQIEVHLASVLGFEGAGLQVDHHEAAELQVIEQQVDVEVAFADVQVKLTADEREALTKFEQERSSW